MRISPTFSQSDIDQLLEFAKQEFRLGSGPDSLRSKLESVQRQTGIEPAELQNLIELPELMTFVWMYFIELHNSRSSNGYGVNPLSYSDIYAYFKLMNIEPLDWEVQVIKKLDFIALQAYADQAEKQKNQASSKRKK